MPDAKSEYDNIVARFMGKVEKHKSGCWLWLGYCLKPRRKGDGGYGIFAINESEVWRAHRLSWVLFNGMLWPWQWVLHRCDVRHCVNPEHLFLGDHETNMADMVAKGRGHRAENNDEK